MSTVATRIGISLEVGCCEDGHGTGRPLLSQLTLGSYDEMSVMPLPLKLSAWRVEHRTARKRADRAFSRGYFPGALQRQNHADDIHAINTSATHRQGRRMTSGYLDWQEYAPLPNYPCPRHSIRTTGVFQAGSMRLVGYLTMIRAGQLALVSQILGHADHLENEIMYLLFEHALEREITADPEALVVYNRHDSGTDGLRFFKERLGFEPMPVEWLP